MTDVWKSGTTYVPGSLVIPSTTAPAQQLQPSNAGFESGDLTSWSTTDTARWVVGAASKYEGAYGCRVSSDGLTSMQSATKPAIAPGQSVSVSAKVRITNAGTDDAHFQVVLQFFDGAGTLLPGYVPGNEIQGKGGFWATSTASGAAPAGAASFNISLSANPGSHGSVIDVDAVSYDYAFAVPPPGLVFKATQAAPGKSGTSEPTWPATTGVSVTDNEVTWEGVIATRLVWQASPILKSSGAEPVWPLDVGGAVRDGTIDWVAISRRVEDANCPNSKVVAIMASKVFAADGDIVRFSATINPLDWTSEQNAGYLPTGLRQANGNDMAVLAPYRSNMATFNPDGFQNWQVDEDPAAMAQLDQMDGIGSNWQQAAKAVGNDLFYLSQLGVRTVSVAAGTDSLAAGDVGIPIDSLVQAAMAARPAGRYIATYYPSAGQYWLAFPDYLSISGNIPDGAVGDKVSYQYLVDSSRNYTAALPSGALPTGLSMSATGLVTGTLTSPGAFSWGVDATNTTGDVATLSDSATVSLRTSGIWLLLGTGNNTTVDFSTSPDAWSITRSLSVPFNVKQSPPAWNGSALAVLTTTPANSVAIIQSQTVTGATVTDSVVALPYAYTRISGFSGVFIAWDGVNPYAYSTNSGATWTTVTGPSGLLLSGIARMASGRWIAFFRSGATQQLYYSDQAIPTTWTLALGGVAGTGNYDIATDGTTAVFTNNIGNAYISADGATWSASGVFTSGSFNTPTMLISPAKGIFIAAGFSGAPPSIARSADSGATWTLIALPTPNSGGRVLSMSSHGGTVTAQTSGEEYISTDYGATWTKPARAPLTNATIAYLGSA